MIRFLFIGMLLLCFLGNVEAIANQSDNGKKKGKIKENFYYALPENYFTVTVVIDKITAHKGPLSEHAGKITGLASVVKEDVVYYAVSRVSLEKHAQIDLQHVYYVEITHKHTIPYYAMYKNLLLSAYNTVTASSWQEKQTVNQENTFFSTQNRFSIYPSEAMIEKYDTIYVQEMIDSVAVQVPKISKRLITKPTQQQAAEAIKMIETIREARWLLISGDHEVDYTTLELMLAELQKKENEYVALFGGITEKEELTYTFTVIPTQKGNVINIPLFQFSQKQGVSSGIKDAETVNYTLRLTSKGIHEAIEKADKKFAENKSAKKKDGKNSLYYRKPQYFMFSLYRENHLIQDFGIYPISQFGETVPLPENASFFEIDSLTGALKFIEITK